MKIYWNPLSPPANRVIFCANYLGIKYEKILVDLSKGEQLTDEYKSMNPFGKVPLLEDDGYHLFESGAIIRYLARKEKSTLYPSTYQ